MQMGNSKLWRHSLSIKFAKFLSAVHARLPSTAMPALAHISFNSLPACHLAIQAFTYTVKLAIYNVQLAPSRFHRLIHAQRVSVHASLAQIPRIALPVLLDISSKDQSVFLHAAVPIFLQTVQVATVNLAQILVLLAAIRTQ
jgi:hypothetical protein